MNMFSQRLSIFFFILCASSPLYLWSCANPSQKAQLKSVPEDSLQKEADIKPVSIAGLVSGETEAPTPEEANRKLAQYGHDWFYGGGLGRTALNVGTVVLFPPYAIYLVGNACLQLADQEPLYVTDALPDSSREGVLNAYNELTSVPGRIAAGIGREEFVENK